MTLELTRRRHDLQACAAFGRQPTASWASDPVPTCHITKINVMTEASVPNSTTLEACSIQLPYWRANT